MTAGSSLQRVTIERQPNGGWRVLRERSENAELYTATDLIDAFSYVRAAYFANGEFRGSR